MKDKIKHKKRKRHSWKPLCPAKKIEKSSQKTDEPKPTEKKREKIKTKKVQLGWKHFREEDNAYVLVPLAKGGGSRTVDVPITTSRFELYQTCKNLFFPDGQ